MADKTGKNIQGSSELTYPKTTPPLKRRYQRGGTTFKSVKNMGGNNNTKKSAQAKGLRNLTVRAAARRGNR